MIHQRENEQGQAIVILAFVMVGLLAFAALAIDGGNTYTERRRAQNAADAGALAGARQLWLNVSQSNYSDEAIIRTTINAVAEKNGVTDSNGVGGDFIDTNVSAYYTDRNGVRLSDTEVGSLGAIPSNAGGIEVLTRRKFGTFIAGIIGRGTMGAEAVATAVYIAPPGCGDFAIFASGDPDNPINNLSVTGGGQAITITGGGLYSGGDTHVNNVNINDGEIVSVGQCGPSQAQCDGTGAPVLNAQPPQTVPTWDITEFYPGGAVQQAVGNDYHYIDGNLTSLSAGDGVYYVTGNVDIHDVGPNRVTIVSQGEQKYNGVVNISAYYNNLLVLSNSSNQTQGAIKISTSDSVWEGLVYAPNGDVNMSGASNTGVQGAIYGVHVSLSGAHIDITYDPASCPLTRALIRLLK